MLLSGEPKVYVKVGESGNRREQTFCADCGTLDLLCASWRSRPRRSEGRHYASARPAAPS